MKWVKTSLRKGTKTPKICRDMFITDTRGKYKICQLKNGRLVKKEAITVETAKRIINENNLVTRPCIFNGCFTYRDPQSAELVDKLLAT